MSKVQQLELAVKELSPGELAEFRAWYAEFEQDMWDEQPGPTHINRRELRVLP